MSLVSDQFFLKCAKLHTLYTLCKIQENNNCSTLMHTCKNENRFLLLLLKRSNDFIVKSSSGRSFHKEAPLSTEATLEVVSS